ncbi:MAG TPA: hypothetical protein VH391_08680 [Solirubrobacterales bacterium]
MADGERHLLDRATEALERVDQTLERQTATLAGLFRRMEERDALANERHEALMREHRRLLDRFARSEDRVVEALGDLHLEASRNTARLDDMKEGIRANTQAVLSMLDRLGPATG